MFTLRAVRIQWPKCHLQVAISSSTLSASVKRQTFFHEPPQFQTDTLNCGVIVLRGKHFELWPSSLSPFLSLSWNVRRRERVVVCGKWARSCGQFFSTHCCRLCLTCSTCVAGTASPLVWHYLLLCTQDVLQLPHSFCSALCCAVLTPVSWSKQVGCALECAHWKSSLLWIPIYLWDCTMSPFKRTIMISFSLRST